MARVVSTFLALAVGGCWHVSPIGDVTGAAGDASSDSDTDTDSDSDADTDACPDGAASPGLAGTTWVTICGGAFEMGSDDGAGDEQPVHTVTVPTFELLETEVTVTEYRACVDATECVEPITSGLCAAGSLGNWNAAGREDHPVNCVTWSKAVSFCAWIGGRLASEAEWEFAARSGGQDIDYPWGDEAPTCSSAVMFDESGYGCGTEHTWATCSKTAGNTDQDLCDMAGNAQEWVQDWYHGSYTDAPSDGSAWENPVGSFRILRGGSLFGLASTGSLRAVTRVSCDPDAAIYSNGFRCAR
jgi:formylglycine-generating enzyme required for sulfatase activity